MQELLAIPSGGRQQPAPSPRCAVSHRAFGRRVVTGARASWQITPATEQHQFWRFCQTNLWKYKYIPEHAVRTPPTRDHRSWSQTQPPNARSGRRAFISSDEHCAKIPRRAQQTRWKIKMAQELKWSNGTDSTRGGSCRRLTLSAATTESPGDGSTKPELTENITY